MHRIWGVVAIGVALVLAGCGGTDWNTAQNPAVKSARTAKSSQSPRAIAAEKKLERPLVAALVANAKASDPKVTAKESAALSCTAAAIVHGYGAAAFTANGLSANALRNPKSSLDPLPDPTPAQISRIGLALQKCRVDVVAAGLAAGLHVADPAQIACLAGHFGTGPDAQRFLVLNALGRKIDLGAAHDLVGIIASCISLPELMLDATGLKFAAATRACLVNAMNGTDAELKDYFALKLSGTDPTTAQEAIEKVGVAMNHCRPGAHTGFTVPSG